MGCVFGGGMLRGGLSTSPTVTALGFFLGTPVCDLCRHTCVVWGWVVFFFFCEPLHPQFSSDDQAKASQFHLAWALRPQQWEQQLPLLHPSVEGRWRCHLLWLAEGPVPRWLRD